ncbi:uncharacterized protein LOC34620741, partial [Cyclospora cayetanensis]|uniref:Pantoate--beta-alanine ligase n=1 Tax=Cyclospora cayetanensis TaxID=88456 RepID=A0A6P6RTL3_9EIME
SPCGTSPRQTEMLILRTSSEVAVHRSRRPPLREGFPPSCPILGATEEQQLLQRQEATAGGSHVGPRRRIGFVPTLGGLHEGHLSLIRAASRQCDEVWVSIFLNPTQFQSQNDFDSYPGDLQSDIQLLRTKTETQVLFLPDVREMYPNLAQREARDDTGAQGTPVGTQSAEASFADLEINFRNIECCPGEGSRRPGFFKGVGQIVQKLFALVRPTHVFFGQKDFLQTVCVRALKQQQRQLQRVHGDLLPPLLNSPEAVAGPSVALLPPHAAPCVLLLRSLSLRLFHMDPARGAPGEEKILGELEALELSDAAVQRLSGEEQRVLWPWGAWSEKKRRTDDAPQTEYFLLRDHKEPNASTLIAYLAFTRGPGKSTSASERLIEIQRLFVAPSRRRSGLGEAFFGVCMLALHQQCPQQQQLVTCVVPRLAIKVVESLGLAEAPESPTEGKPGDVSVCVDLHRLVQRLLRP